MNDDEDYAEFLADYILTYLVQQQAAGRKIVTESEIWQILGQPFPKDRQEQIFDLSKDAEVRTGNNVISLEEFKKSKNKLN